MALLYLACILSKIPAVDMYAHSSFKQIAASLTECTQGAWKLLIYISSVTMAVFHGKHLDL